jgi:hypothetical protein
MLRVFPRNAIHRHRAHQIRLARNRRPLFHLLRDETGVDLRISTASFCPAGATLIMLGLQLANRLVERFCHLIGQAQVMELLSCSRYGTPCPLILSRITTADGHRRRSLRPFQQPRYVVPFDGDNIKTKGAEFILQIKAQIFRPVRRQAVFIPVNKHVRLLNGDGQ